MFGEEDLIKLHAQRATQIANIVFGCFVLLILRLWYLQVFKGEVLHNYSIQNRLRKEVIWAPRGRIYSRDGVLLVDNVPRFDAILTPQFLSEPDKTLKRLSEILNLPMETIKKVMQKNAGQAKYRPIIIKKNISFEEVAKIETENSSLPGIEVDTFISREYKYKEIGAHLLGYISEISQSQLPILNQRDNFEYRLGDFIGQFGLEEQYDSELRGINGHEFVEVDATGRKKKYINTDNLFKGIEDDQPTPGKTVKLTIDNDLQLAAFEGLNEKVGSLIAIDPNNGQILAMVSRPAFEPSQFSKGLTPEYWGSLMNDKNNPLRDRNIQEHYSPGSTFKPFTAIAALEEGIITPNFKYRCHGSYRLGSRVYHSWKKEGGGVVDVVDALMQSCNIFFYKIATDMDIDVLAKYANMFGFGMRTGVTLPREVAGLIPTKEWKQKKNGVPWQLGETLSCSIGQSYVLSSTIQLANAYAAIANKGKVYRPYIVKEFLDQEGKTINVVKPELLREIKLKESTWDLVRQGLYKVVNSPQGTAFYRRGQGNQMAGKTGTSQVVRAASADKLYSSCTSLPYEYRHHGLFVAFAPYDKPKIAVAALVEHGCGGSSAAAPVAEKVVTTFMQKYYPDLVEENKIKEKEQIKKIYQAPKPKAEDAEDIPSDSQAEST
jgi:penicillin-binding protein 2